MEYTSEPETDFRWERKPHPMCIPHVRNGIKIKRFRGNNSNFRFKGKFIGFLVF